MTRRLVITVPLDDSTADGFDLAEVIQGQVIPDLGTVAGGLVTEGEMRTGQYGFTTDPSTHAVRVHWAIKAEDSS